LHGQKTVSRRAWILAGSTIVGLGALAAIWRFTPLADYLTSDEIRSWARALRRVPWAPAALVFAYTPASLVMFPTPVLTLFAVIAFGAWTGAAYALGGIMLSAFALYVVGRYVRYEKVRKFASRGVDTARDLAHDHGIMTIIAANLMPVPPFGVQCFIAGAVRMKFWEFALGNLISRAPGVIVAALFARELLAALDDDSPVNYWLLAPAALAFIAFWYYGRRWALNHQRRPRRRRRKR
jgi:phospholipase D1/2